MSANHGRLRPGRLLDSHHRAGKVITVACSGHIFWVAEKVDSGAAVQNRLAETYLLFSNLTAKSQFLTKLEISDTTYYKVKF